MPDGMAVLRMHACPQANLLLQYLRTACLLAHCPLTTCHLVCESRWRFSGEEDALDQPHAQLVSVGVHVVPRCEYVRAGRIVQPRWVGCRGEECGGSLAP
jgi:hypothetical protein